MPQHANAWDILNLGDAIRARVARDRTTVAAVASDAGFTEPVATKAAWLAGVYDGGARRRLGRSVLSRLSRMHLEVVATAPTERRESLLRRAATEGLTARSLRALTRTSLIPSSETPTSDTLTASTRAMEIYAGFSDQTLRSLIEGPNGPTVLRAATAGRALATRIAEFTT